MQKPSIYLKLYLLWKLIMWPANYCFQESEWKNELFQALFVLRKPNSRNPFSSFSHVWQPSRKLVKGKLIPVNKKTAFTRRKVFSFPC